MGIKNAEFLADFKPIEKVLKICTKKVISKNMTEICTFTLVLLITFGAFFKHFFNRFKISMKFCVFCYLFDFSKKICLGYISTFFKL
jgi:hypothetical protein